MGDYERPVTDVGTLAHAALVEKLIRARPDLGDVFTETEWGLMPRPKFATKRNHDYPTLGTRQSEFGRVWLGRHMMPWQRMTADILGEYDPETGRPRYSLGVVTVQRQAGKSDLVMVRAGERCLSVPRFKAWYTAQTGMDARDQFLKFDTEVLDGTPLSRVVTTLKGNGHEVMRYPNKSELRPHPPTEKALHGKQSDANDIDEGWAFDESGGRALMQAISPTHLTRPRAQTVVWSAGGTAESTWLANLVARGRNGDPAIAYVEFGIPDDLDLADLEAIAAWHPAFGHTITTEAIHSLRTDLDDDAEFARAGGNRWTEAIRSAIRAGVWDLARWLPAIPEDARVGFGAARAADGAHVVIAAAAQVGDYVVGEVLAEVSPYDAASEVKGWVGREPVAVPGSGPSAALADDLRRLNLPLVDYAPRDESAACTNLLDALAARVPDEDGVERPRFRHRRHALLDAAAKVAGTRTVSDGGRAWSRVQSGGSIAALEAITAASWALRHRAPEGKPVIRFGGTAA